MKETITFYLLYKDYSVRLMKEQAVSLSDRSRAMSERTTMLQGGGIVRPISAEFEEDKNRERPIR